MAIHIEIRQSGRTIAVPQGVSILEAALSEGIAYPHGCRSGRCGSCKSRLVTGKVDLLDHSRFALSEEEKAQGLILACRAISTTDVIVAWLGGDEETQSHPRRRLNCRVAAITDATHDIKRIQLANLREQHARPILCVAVGSGLAPIKGIVEAAIARGMKQPIHVYFGARSERDLYLIDHFEGLAQRHHNLSFTPILSDGPLGSGWRTGFVSDAVANDVQNFVGWKAYVSGPPPMVDAAMQICTERGLRAEDLYADVFFTPTETSAGR